jgi:hypothetical protein
MNSQSAVLCHASQTREIKMIEERKDGWYAAAPVNKDYYYPWLGPFDTRAEALVAMDFAFETRGIDK